MKKVMEEKNRKQQVIEEKLREQQIIEDQNSEKRVIDNILYVKCNAGYIMPLHVFEICGISVDSQGGRTVVYKPWWSYLSSQS